MKTNQLSKACRMAAVASLVMLASSCNDTIDNLFSKNQSVIELDPTDGYIKLDESNPDATALTLKWSSAHDFGEDYITTYKYQMQLIGSTADEIQEYEDDGQFFRTYTNKQLQDILVNHFGQTTSTVGNVLFTVTASFQGPTLVVPDMATATLKIKTYGPKQFKADKMFMAGSAVGDEEVALTRNESDTLIWSYTGQLAAGKVNFPLLNYDEHNAIGPEGADQDITLKDMAAVITDETEAHFWNIPSSGTYRITVNLKNQTVKIVEEGATVDASELYLAGSAVGASQIQMVQTVENANLFAWRGTLSAGSLYIPLMFNGEQAMSIVPLEATEHDINDGQTSTFGQATTGTAAASRYWTIPAAGTYRIVVNIEEKTVTIYSSATDLKPKTVSWNNTTLGINPYNTEVNVLHMYGTFNGFAHDSGVFTGYQEKYDLQPSIANPYVFVYKGDVLPRGTAGDERGSSVTGSVKFTVDNTNNNVYAYGSTADAKRNSYNGYVTPVLGQTNGLVAGQGDNRYAYFIIPEGCNYVEVNIDKLTVVFDKK